MASWVCLFLLFLIWEPLQVTPTAITTVTNTVFLSAVVVTGAGAHQTGACFKIKFCECSPRSAHHKR